MRGVSRRLRLRLCGLSLAAVARRMHDGHALLQAARTLQRRVARLAWMSQPPCRSPHNGSV